MSVFPDEIDLSHNDRYLIYLMLNRHVSIDHRPLRGQRNVTGVVDDVRRNIFDTTVELVLNGKVWTFKEPDIIVGKNGSTFGSVVFVYGGMESELTDEELFAKMASPEDFGETVDEALARTAPSEIRVVEFLLGDRIKNRGKAWRRKS